MTAAATENSTGAGGATQEAERGAAFRDWSERRRITRDSAQRNSRRVKQLRIVIPMIAAAMVAAIVAITAANRVDEGFLLRFAGLNRTISEPQIVNPRFSYVDASGRDYEIEADAALQDERIPSAFNLVNPHAVLSPEASDRTEVNSNAGVYRQDLKIVDLSGNVVLRYAEEYEFRTDAASIMLDEKHLQGDLPVRGEGPMGNVEALGFEVLEGGKRIIFQGDVRLELNQPKPDGDDG